MKRLLIPFIIMSFILTACQEQLPVKGEINHFTLTDANGDTYTSDNGKVKLLTFFYTNCPDICPLTLFELKKVQNTLLEEGYFPEEVEIIAITLDPSNDTAEVLNEYKENYDPNEEGWNFLTGSDEQIKAISDDLKFFYMVSSSGLVSHATTMYLLDEDNQIRALHKMSSMDDNSIDHEKIIDDIESLIK
jgi:protein SCO1